MLRGALPFAERVGFPNAYFRAVMNVSSLGSIEDPREGVEVALRGLEKAERFGYHGWAPFLASNAAWDQVLVGQWDAAVAVVEQHDREDLDDGARLNLAAPVVIVTAYRGDLPAAHRSLDPLGAMADAPSPQDRGLFHELAAHLAFAEQRFEDGYRAALAMADSGLGHYPLRGRLLAARMALWIGDAARLTDALHVIAQIPSRATITSATELGLRAGLHARTGRRDEAKVEYEEAIRRLDDVGAAFDAALLRLERATFLAADPAEREAHGADALDALGALGADALIGFTDRTQGARPEAAPRTESAAEPSH